MVPTSLGCWEKKRGGCGQSTWHGLPSVVAPPPPPQLSSWLLPLPVLVSGLLGRRQCQSAGSAGLATDLQSTQAVKAA